MSKRDLHDSEFDAATQLKLEIFRGYISRWIRVFLAQELVEEIHIYDFFSGPGTDSTGKPGTPLQIIDEVEDFATSSFMKRKSPYSLHLHFNDADKRKTDKLEQLVHSRQKRAPYIVEFASMPFDESLSIALPAIRTPKSANLLIIDQYGLKEVGASTFKSLVACPRTDILFFLSSSHVRRFISVDSIHDRFAIAAEDLREVPVKDVHRRLCNYYRDLVPAEKEYYVAPFSIEKGSNIYGIVFGSGHLRGLELFLEVCWDHDKVSGEANYNIEDEIIYAKQTALFPEDSVPRKIDRFRRDLFKFISDFAPNNVEVARFTIGSGFLITHAAEYLRECQQRDEVQVTELTSEKPVRRGWYYLGHKDRGKAPRVQFSIKDYEHGAQ